MKKDKSSRPSCSYWYKLHNWTYISKYYYSTFLGEQIKNHYRGYKRCDICDIVHEYQGDEHGSSWVNLGLKKSKIFNRKFGVEVTEIKG
jgi:hypothetical protein